MRSHPSTPWRVLAFAASVLLGTPALRAQVIDSHPTGSTSAPPPGSGLDNTTRRPAPTEVWLQLAGGGMLGTTRNGALADARAYAGVRFLPLLAGGGWVGIGTMVLPPAPTASLTMPNPWEARLRYQGGLWMALHFGPTVHNQRVDPWVGLELGVMGTTPLDGYSLTWVSVGLSAGLGFRLVNGIHLGPFVHGGPQFPVACTMPSGVTTMCTNGPLFAEFVAGLQLSFGPSPQDLEAMRP